MNVIDSFNMYIDHRYPDIKTCKATS